MKKPILIGITGGTGSGKSTIADALYSNFSKDRITMIQQDMYYKGVLNEQIVYILFFYILRDAGNCSEYGRHLSTSSSVIVSDADS